MPGSCLVANAGSSARRRGRTCLRRIGSAAAVRPLRSVTSLTAAFLRAAFRAHALAAIRYNHSLSVTPRLTRMHRFKPASASNERPLAPMLCPRLASAAFSSAAAPVMPRLSSSCSSASPCVTYLRLRYHHPLTQHTNPNKQYTHIPLTYHPLTTHTPENLSFTLRCTSAAF